MRGSLHECEGSLLQRQHLEQQQGEGFLAPETSHPVSLPGSIYSSSSLRPRAINAELQPIEGYPGVCLVTTPSTKGFK